jgi:hypothetical protein
VTCCVAISFIPSRIDNTYSLCRRSYAFLTAVGPSYPGAPQPLAGKSSQELATT